MKKFLVSALLLVSVAGSAKSLPDSVAMIVGNKQVLMSEFFYAAEKNGENNLSDEDALKGFVQLFENFSVSDYFGNMHELFRTSPLRPARSVRSARSGPWRKWGM